MPIGVAYALRDPTRLVETVQEALLEGHDLIILGGGDGSVSTVVDLLAESDAMLGLLPLGTANDFARTLRIPFDLEAACDTVAHGKIVYADLGLAKPADLDGLLQVAVGNGRFYGGGLVVAPHSSIEDEALDVYTLTAGKGLDLARLVWGLRSGEFVENPGVRYWRTSRVCIETDPALPINLDGELVSRTPKLFSVAPKAIKVLVPKALLQQGSPHPRYQKWIDTYGGEEFGALVEAVLDLTDKVCKTSTLPRRPASGKPSSPPAATSGCSGTQPGGWKGGRFRADG